MYFKIVFCASVLFIQTINAQCGCGSVIQAAPACGCPNTLIYAARPCAASLTVSPCPLPGAPNIPAGMSIASDNLLISGPVIVAGKLPFAGTVGLEGALPACGSGAVSYGCGDVIGAVTESPMVSGIGFVGGNYGCGGLLY